MEPDSFVGRRQLTRGHSNILGDYVTFCSISYRKAHRMDDSQDAGFLLGKKIADHISDRMYTRLPLHLPAKILTQFAVEYCTRLPFT